MKKLLNGSPVDMTAAEIADFNARQAAFEVEKVALEKMQKRQKALSAKWPDPFALLDDILKRGIASVKAEREAIKSANPKV